MKIKSPKDFWAGVMFIGTGLFFALWAMEFYQMGTAVRMGPAYFPAVLGFLLVVLGGVILAGSFVIQGPPVPAFQMRPLFMVTVATIAYGYAMKPLGLIGATAALVYISAAGGHEFNWKEVTILFVALILMSIFVFVKGLTLPFPICPDFIENCPIR
ncbi:MAG TPA: tripartite tricarboxylate transporter TctB family protein [Burkholderiales bacterium]|nr:tripartite tricarboxylate transporter TctB family protein [Burkholderiales bacterium]